jgi:NAD(P)H dehydrogenase (quinone)
MDRCGRIGYPGSGKERFVKYLIVYAHPDPKSFNRALLGAVERRLDELGAGYDVRDLYALGFDPVLARGELAPGGANGAPRDAQREREFVAGADALIFIYPVWWFAMPAIMKGYIDRVFAEGFAFAFEGGRFRGLLGGKRVFIINTTGSPREILDRMGYEDAMRITTDAGIFGFCGMEVALHRYFFAVPEIDEAARRIMLKEVTQMDF